MCMGSGCTEGRACARVCRCCSTGLACRRFTRSLEGIRDNFVSVYLSYYFCHPKTLYRVIGVPSSTAYMLTYDHLLNNTFPSIFPASIVPMVSGISARTMVSTIASPLELIRTNLQSTPLSPETPHTLRSVLTSLRECVRTQGVTSLWRGVGPTLWRDVPFSGFYWASYETLKQFFARNGQEGAWIAFLSGATSGTAAALMTSPLDVVKTRRQALVFASPETRGLSSFAFLARIARTEGVGALFAGVTPRMVKIAPACGIMIASFEGVGKLLGKPKMA